MRDHSLHDANMCLCQYRLIPIVAEVCAEMPTKRWETCAHRKLGCFLILEKLEKTVEASVTVLWAMDLKDIEPMVVAVGIIRYNSSV